MTLTTVALVICINHTALIQQAAVKEGDPPLWMEVAEIQPGKSHTFRLPAAAGSRYVAGAWPAGSTPIYVVTTKHGAECKTEGLVLAPPPSGTER